MKSRIAIANALFAVMFGSGAVGADQPREQLFNGKDLTGWSHAGKGSFSIEDGALKTEGGMGLLWYAEEKIGDAIIRVVYKGSRPNANSGASSASRKSLRTPGFPFTAGMRCRSPMEVTSSIEPARFIRCRALKSYLLRVPAGTRWRSGSKGRKPSSA